jgi:hypothetical protein
MTRPNLQFQEHMETRVKKSSTLENVVLGVASVVLAIGLFFAAGRILKKEERKEE